MAKEAIEKTVAVSQEVIEKVGGEKNLRRVELPTDDTGEATIEVIVSVPDRRVMGQYLKYQNVNPAKAQEILVKACLHTSREEVLADDGLFFSCVGAIAELIPLRDAKIKKY
ncbi:MAG: hypothetical protein U1C58_06280 [Flavobacteriaceae bacterium]|nr:hypothetical protein [Flavobacteriaceae bacterium]